MTTTATATALAAMIVVAGLAGYYAFSQRSAGGNAGSSFSYSLTQSTFAVPKGEVLVVVPDGANSNSSLNFQPDNLRLELGVNSTVLFYNEDTTGHYIESLLWPSGPNTFQFSLLPGRMVAVPLNTTGFYSYNFEPGTGPLLNENGNITVFSG